MSEEQHQRILRYQALVDQEFRGGITPEQAAEMERLGVEIDAFYEPFYGPIIKRLEAQLRGA